MKAKQMTYFEDLSQYKYGPFAHQSSPNLRNVGWLDAEYVFSRGLVDPKLVLKLCRLCRKPVNRTRGWHACHLCSECPAKIEFEGEPLALGDAEIRVCGKNGVIYAAPTMIVHYIERHEYHPPEEFIEAVDALDIDAA